MSSMDQPKPLRKTVYNPRVVNRLRQAIQEREFRKELLLSPKNQLMTAPLEQKQLQHDFVEKCSNCRVGKEGDVIEQMYENTALLCTRFDDMLKERYRGEGFMQLCKVEYRRLQLNRTLKSLKVHPACRDILRACLELSFDFSVVFVVEPSESEANRILLDFILMLEGFTNVGWSSIKPRSTSILVLDKAEATEELRKAEHNETIVLVPVTINFDKIDGRIFHDNLGVAQVNVIEPYAKRDMMTKTSPVERRSAAIIDHLKHDIMKKMPIMCTNVLAFLLLTRFRADGSSLECVCRAFDEIRQRHRHSVEFAFVGDTRAVLAYAMETLNELIIVQEDDNVKASDEKLRALSMYAKPLARHFALESILMASAEYLDDKRSEIVAAEEAPAYTIDREQLVGMAELLVEKFNDEFQLLAPCVDVGKVVEEKLDVMRGDDFFRTAANDEAEELDPDEIRARRMYANMDIHDSDSEDEAEQLKVGYYDLRINYEERMDEIQFLGQVMPELKDQLVHLPMDAIVLIVVRSYKDAVEDGGMTLQEQIEQIIDDVGYLAEILNNEYYMHIEPSEIDEQAKVAWTKCLAEGYVVFDREAVKLNEEKSAEIEEMVNQILPTVDAYYTVAVELRNMAKSGTKRSPNNEFIDICIKKLSEEIEDGKAKFPQSLSKVVMRNALKFCEQKNFLKQLSDNRGFELIKSAEELHNLAQSIAYVLPY